MRRALGSHAGFVRAVGERRIGAVLVLVALDADVPFADRPGWIRAILVRRARNAVSARTHRQCWVVAIGVGAALDAFAVGTSRRCCAAILVAQASHAVARAEIAEGALGFRAIGVGGASKVALAIDTAGSRRGAVGIDQALVTPAVIQVADRSGCPAVGG